MSSTPLVVATATPKAPYTYLLSAAKSAPATGHNLVSFVWSVGGRVIGRGEKLTHRFPVAGHRYLVTLQVTDDAGDSAFATLVVQPHVRKVVTEVTLPTIQFAFDKATLTPKSKALMRRAKGIIGDATNVTIFGFTANGPGGKGSFGVKWSARLSRERAQTVERLLFGAHPPRGTHVVIKGLGRAHTTGAPQAKDRKTKVRVTRTKVVAVAPVAPKSAKPQS